MYLLCVWITRIWGGGIERYDNIRLNDICFLMVPIRLSVHLECHDVIGVEN